MGLCTILSRLHSTQSPPSGIMNTPTVNELPPFAGGRDVLPSRFEEARIEGARMGQLELGAPSTLRGVRVTAQCSPADVFAAEKAAGVIPIGLRRHQPPGSTQQQGASSPVVMMGPGGRVMREVQ